jgi:hypothetical protein
VVKPGKKYPWRTRPELPFLLFLVAVLLAYTGLIVLLVAANALTVSLPQALEILRSPEIRHVFQLHCHGYSVRFHRDTGRIPDVALPVSGAGHCGQPA